MIKHELKTWPEMFTAIASGAKRFEIRKYDRSFAVGDMLVLREWNNESLFYTGASLETIVTFIVKGGQWGLPADVVVMSLGPIMSIRVID